MSIPSHLFSYGLLQGRTRYRHDQDERSFMEDIYHTYSPFYTGPLLAPSAHTVPKGKVNVQPYLFWQKVYGAYDRKWKQKHVASTVTLQSLVIAQYGLTNFMDINLSTQGVYKQFGNQHGYNLGDSTATVGFELLSDFLNTGWPACAVEVGAIFPTGHFEKLNDRRLGTDFAGGGAYAGTISLNFQKSFNKIFRRAVDPLKYHPFLFRWSFGYEIPGKVNVKGINAYGGANNTNGKVTPGQTFTTIFAWEYSFTKQWVFATDWQYTASQKTTFYGIDGGAKVGGPANQNWSVAPAIEFNMNSNFGALVGVWFSIGGRNSNQFVNGIFSFTWLF